MKTINMELLAIDLDVCGRCAGTLTSMDEAIEKMRPVLDATSTELRVEKVLIESEEQARRYRLKASPTIRVNGHDIAPETSESHCDDCSNLCGSNEGTSCRVWRYRGQEYTEAPVGLIVEAILRELVSNETTETVSEAVGYEEVPENLRRFFAGKAAKQPL